MDKLSVIILCGGSGSRLWPLSRKHNPKQFLSFNKGESLLQVAIKRAQRLTDESDIYLVTNNSQVIELKRNLESIKNYRKLNILIEEEALNTLPAVSIAIRAIKNKSKTSNIVVLPADHIFDEDKIINTLDLAIKNIELTKFCLIGIQPKKPHTGYGYIKPSNSIDRSINNNIYLVKKFHEKPSLKKAKEFCENNFLWNSGLFIFQIDFFLEQLKKINISIYDNFFSQKKINYQNIKPISFDHGFVEKIKNIFVLEYRGKWNDLGDWNSIYEEYKDKRNDNLCIGDIFSHESKNNLFLTDSKKISAFGVDDLVVVNTQDTVFVTKKEKSQEVKSFLDKFKENNSDKLLNFHPKVIRPWGDFTILEETLFYKIKKIRVLPMRALSLQSHKFRNEHWIVVDGTATVIRDGNEFKLKKNESTYIKKNQKHRLINNSKKDLILIEVQVGTYLGEDDIKRYEDKYGR